MRFVDFHMFYLKNVLAVSLVVSLAWNKVKNETNFSALNVTQEGTQDCEGIGREMERVAERMGGTTKWPYNDSDCLDAVSWCFQNSGLVTKLYQLGFMSS